MKLFSLSTVIAVELVAIAALVLWLLATLASWPSPFGADPAVSALDYWAERYQTLSAALIALAAAFTAYGVAHYNRKNEEVDAAKQERTDLIRALRMCLLDMERIHHVLAKIDKVSLAAGVPHVASVINPAELEPASWVTQTASELPLQIGSAILKFYLFAKEGQREFELWHSISDIQYRDRCRIRLMQADVMWGAVMTGLHAVEAGRSLEEAVAVSPGKAKVMVDHWSMTLADLEAISGALRCPCTI
jgi:hypothetical protein